MVFDLTHELVLENEAVLLSPMTLDCYDRLSEVAMKDSELMDYSPKPVHSERLLKDYISEALRQKDGGVRYPFVAFDKRQRRVAGSTSFGNISTEHERLEIGWTWIGRDFQRTGLNRHMKFLMLSYAFETAGCQRVEFKTDARNAQSRRALEGIGAQYEGCLRSHTIMYDGFRRNTIYYSVLLEEWPGIRLNLLSRTR